ncbi:MAG: hypothetical protein ACREF1_09025, partial [Acetobacteraceae bacterium]
QHSSEPAAEAGVTAPGIASRGQGARPEEVWPPERLAITDALWGDGHAIPGGEEEVLRLARPLGLSGACSVLLLGCGPGGAARCIAERLGTWVGGFECDPALVAAATRHCIGAGLGKRARIERWNPAKPRFGTCYYHHALALEPLRLGNAGDIMPALADALRPGSNLVITEVVDVGAADGGASIADWLRVERRTMPPAASVVTGTLERLGFDIRVIEDITQRHVRLAALGWRGLVQGIGAARPTPARAAHLVAEIELWLLRARLMQAGRIRLMRWPAIGREAEIPL